MKKYGILFLSITACSLKFHKSIDVKAFASLNRGLKGVINVGRDVVNTGKKILKNYDFKLSENLLFKQESELGAISKNTSKSLLKIPTEKVQKNNIDEINKLYSRNISITPHVDLLKNKIEIDNEESSLKTLPYLKYDNVGIKHTDVSNIKIEDKNQTLKQLAKKYNSKWKGFFEKLDDNEQEAIMLYTYRSRDINRKLWGENHIKEIYYKNVDDVVKNIDSVISKFKAQDDFIVYKGANRSYFNNLAVGDVFSTGYYFSTSIDESVAEKFMRSNKNISNPLMIEIKVPKESKLVYVGKRSGWQYDKEIILDRNTKYKVKSFSGNKLELEVVDESIEITKHDLFKDKGGRKSFLVDRNVGNESKIFNKSEKDKLSKLEKSEYKRISGSNKIRVYNKKWENKFEEFTEKEKEAMLLYTYKSEDINRKLWGSNHIKEIYYQNVDDIIKNLDSVMEKSVIEENIIVYRGTNRKYFENLKVGEVFEIKSYFNTSLDSYWGKIFNTKIEENKNDPLLIEIKVPKGSKGFYVGHNSGLTYMKELILDRNTKYKVLSFDDEKLQLEVVK